MAEMKKLEILNAQDCSLWRKTKSLTKECSYIPPLKHAGQWHTTAQAKADIFSAILSDQFSPNPDNNQTLTDQISQKLEEPLQLSPFSSFFSPGDVRNVTNRIANKKSPGFDLITPQLVKNLPRKGIVFLTQIFNAMLRTTHIPRKWKHAEVVMIKKPNKTSNDPLSYRPISLLSIFSKLFEKLLLPKLLTHLHTLIPDTQFGFRPSHSCPMQLHRVIDQILETYETKKICLGVFLDTEKCFDKVVHESLLYKMKPHLPDTYYRIVQSYLAGRTFSVRYRNAISTSRPILAGVPQGSVIAPFLYLIYSHDLPQPEGTTVAQFADDVALLQVDESLDDATTGAQSALDSTSEWCSLWRTKINASKSVVIPFTKRRIDLQNDLLLNSTPIPQDTKVRYLGIYLDKTLTWETHIKHLVTRIRRRIVQLKSLLGEHSPISLSTKRLLYLSVIRPIWEYSSGLWGSAAESHINKIQVTQNRVLRMITGAPWYVRNSTLHHDLHLPTVREVIQTNYKRLNDVMVDHENATIASIPQNPPPPRDRRRLKRKRPQDSLSDPL